MSRIELAEILHSHLKNLSTKELISECETRELEFEINEVVSLLKDMIYHLNKDALIQEA